MLGEDVRSQCRVREMHSYGLRVWNPSLSTENEVCPGIQGGNCCGEIDQALIKTYWYRDRKSIEEYYRSVLFPLKYILGFGRQYQ